MKQVIDNNTILSRSIGEIEKLCKFNGEEVVSLPNMTGEESAKLGVYLIERGDNAITHGAHVIARHVSSLKKEDDVKAFKTQVRAEFAQLFVERALKLTFASDAVKELETTKAKANKAGDTNAELAANTAIMALVKAESDTAKKKGEKKYDNVFQRVRVACFSAASGINMSLDSGQKAIAALEDKTHVAHAAVEKLFRDKGKSVTQAEVVKTMDAAKEAAEKKAADSAPKMTTDQVREQTVRNNYSILQSRLVAALLAWNALLEAGVKPETIRATLMDAKDPSKGSIRGSVLSLAQLAQLEVNASAVSVNEKGKA